jgi:tight adherence protein B
VKESIAHPSFDLIIEALLIARELGGAELLNILRLLSKFIREDLSLRREIEVKQSWIKNSAHLSAAAPWILLLLLSTQPSTSQAFSTPTGVLILGTGLGLTAVAYFWMNSLSRIPAPNRIFIDLPSKRQ